MERAEVKKFVRDDGVLDEFALMNSKKKELPLHYMLFRSHAAHLGQELPSSVTGGLPCAHLSGLICLDSFPSVCVAGIYFNICRK